MTGVLGLYYTYTDDSNTVPSIIPPRNPGTNEIVKSINEGASVTFVVGVTGTVYTSTGLTWGIEYITADNLDFTGSQAGTITLSAKDNWNWYYTGAFTVTARADLTTEGAESFRVFIRDPNTNQIISYSPTILINDTSVTPPTAEYTSPGTYSWTCPAGVTRVNALCIGGGGGGGMATRPLATYRDGGGGGGGGLGWRNNISVTPGQTYTVVVGAGGSGASTVGITGSNGGNSFFSSSSTVCGFGGAGGLGGNFGGSGGQGGSYNGDGGGRGGNGGGGSAGGLRSGGGGGAGGYSGDGGYGGTGTSSAAAPGLAANTSGGGAGGGSSGNKNSFSNVVGAGAGGGVGIYGRSGTGGGTETPISNASSTTSHGGRAGSSGSTGTSVTISGTGPARSGGSPGNYGGGGGGSCSNIIAGTSGAGGAVRLVWRTGSSWPSTNVGL